jgi:hypothetical protein
MSCWLHKSHSPIPHLLDAHHITPKSWYVAAGRAIDTRTLTICPTGHSNVHTFIDLLVAHAGTVPWTLAKHIGLEERVLATLGYARGVAAGLTPKPTL